MKILRSPGTLHAVFLCPFTGVVPYRYRTVIHDTLPAPYVQYGTSTGTGTAITATEAK